MSAQIDDVDVVADFVKGQDRIDLHFVDTNSVLAGDQAFAILPNPDTYNGDWSRMLWSVVNAGVTTIYASTDADGEVEMQISLTGTYHLAASDFIL